MTSVHSPGRHPRAPVTRMRSVVLAFAGLVLVALALAHAPGGARADATAARRFLAEAAPAAWPRAPEYQAQGAAGWQSAAFRGLSCSRCNSATQYCVLNPIRYEYACAPLGSVACISASRTHWCPASRGCWAGRCR